MPDIAIRNVTKFFGPTCVLNDINLDVGNGEVVVVVGGSGSGKTTLLRCINRLETVTSGSIEILGEDITRQGADVAAIRRNLGMVFQQINLYPHLSALDNVGLALRKVLRLSRGEAERVALSYLEQMELAEKARAMPHELSGGQQQRVGIARALALEPKVVLFDEPTSALDPELVGEVALAMQTTKATGKAMVVVTHEMNLAREIADCIVFMDRGEIVLVDTPERAFEIGRHPRIDAFLKRHRGA